MSDEVVALLARIANSLERIADNLDVLDVREYDPYDTRR